MTVIRPRYLAVAVATGLVLTAAAGGVGYAAGSTASNVSACVSSKGRLAVQNSKGKCPKKYKKVAIAKQGPRGATGNTGATGKTGAQGPGAVALRQNFYLLGQGAAKVVDGITYTPSCTSPSSGTIVATLTITAPSGKSVSLRGIANDGPNGGAITQTAFQASPQGTVTQVVLANGGQAHQQWLPGALVETNELLQTVTMRISANPNGSFPIVPFCVFEGTITPAA